MDDQRRLERREASIRRRQTMRVVLVAVVLAIAVALAVDNVHRVRLDYLVGDREAPLIIALAVAFLLGVVAGAGARRGGAC